MSKKAQLILEDGAIFNGFVFGSDQSTSGEVVFSTGMVGYTESLTDPSYYGQVVVNTTSHIGNYGVHSEEQESTKPKIAGLVVNDYSIIHSRFQSKSSLQEYLENNEIVGISNVDTRKIVRHIRSKGAMNCLISSEMTILRP